MGRLRNSGKCSMSVPTLACVTGNCRVTVGYEAEGKSPRAESHPGVTGEGKGGWVGGWVNDSELLMRLRYREL